MISAAAVSSKHQAKHESLMFGWKPDGRGGSEVENVFWKKKYLFFSLFLLWQPFLVLSIAMQFYFLRRSVVCKRLSRIHSPRAGVRTPSQNAKGDLTKVNV